jgi:hypothetical protein
MHQEGADLKGMFIETKEGAGCPGSFRFYPRQFAGSDARDSCKPLALRLKTIFMHHAAVKTSAPPVLPSPSPKSRAPSLGRRLFPPVPVSWDDDGGGET